MTDTIRFDVEGMTCASCAVRIERVLSKQEGVESAVVNFAGQEARATVAEGTDVERLRAAVARIGYDIDEIHPDDARISVTERGFSFGLRNLLCFDCAVRRGGRYDAERDTWTESPDVAGLADEAYGDVDEKPGA